MLPWKEYNLIRKSMESITIPAHIIQEIEKHALDLRPNEACGILAGRDLRSCRIHRMTNTDLSPVSYFMDPAEQFRIFREIRQRGEEMLAIYHSHPVSDAYPSSKDVELAFYPDVLYIIASLIHSPSVIRAFTIIEGIIEEKKIVPL